MGRFITLPGVLPPTDRPKVDVLDPILPESGALFLTEAMHPVVPWGSGLVPRFPNIAAEQAGLLLGAPVDQSEVVNYYLDDGQFGGPNYGLAERSGKGGLHVIWTERSENLIQGNKGVFSDLHQTIENYLYADARLGTRLYISIWTRTTRPTMAGGQTNWHTSFGQASSITGKYWYGFPAQASVPASTNMNVPYEGRYGDSQNALAPRRRSFGQERGVIAPWSGNPQGYLINFGSSGTANSYQSARNRVGSNIFYRFYLEDMTVSGRTYAEVDAIDAALFAEAFGPGGRYYNDVSYTDPATIP